MTTLLFSILFGQIFPQCIHGESYKKNDQNCSTEILFSAISQPLVVFEEDNPRFPIELRVTYNGQIDSIHITDLINKDICGNDQDRFNLFDNGENLDRISGDNVWTTEIPVRCFNFNSPFKVFSNNSSYRIEVSYIENNERLKAEYFFSHWSLSVSKGFLSDLDTTHYHQLNDTIAYVNNLVNILELTDLSHDDSQKYKQRLLSVDLFRKSWNSHSEDIVSILHPTDVSCRSTGGAFADGNQNVINYTGLVFNILNHELNHIWFNQNGLDLTFNEHHARYLERNTSGFNFQAECYSGFFDTLYVEDKKIYGKVIPAGDWYDPGIMNQPYRLFNYFNDIELYLMGASPIDSVCFPINYLPTKLNLICSQTESNENLYQLTDHDAVHDSIYTMSQKEFEIATLNKASFGINSQIDLKFLLISKTLHSKKELLVLDHIITLYKEYFSESTYGLAELNTQVDKIIDLDNDGYLSDVDCDDSSQTINPSQVEIPYNNVDDDCNENTFDDDLDQDGYNLVDDCDDLDSTINPGLTEVPDNTIDENCDGIVETTTSTDELSGIKFSIYPNPTSDVLFIEFEDHLDIEITLFSPTQNIYLQPSESRQLNLNSMESGIYFLVIRDIKSSHRITRKIIKY